MTIKVIREQKESYRTGSNIGELISFQSNGWWGDGPISFRRENNEWKMSTSSGGQNPVDVLDQIRDMKAMLEYAESAILEQRSVKQEHDGMEIVG